MPSRPLTRPSDARGRRSSAFVHKDPGTATGPALLVDQRQPRGQGGEGRLVRRGFGIPSIACPTGSFRVLVSPSGVDVSISPLRSACLRTRRRAVGTQRPDALYADRG